jgi:hypothetical protein
MTRTIPLLRFVFYYTRYRLYRDRQDNRQPVNHPGYAIRRCTGRANPPAPRKRDRRPSVRCGRSAPFLSLTAHCAGHGAYWLKKEKPSELSAAGLSIVFFLFLHATSSRRGPLCEMYAIVVNFGCVSRLPNRTSAAAERGLSQLIA